MDSIASALGQTIRRHRLAAQLTHEKLAERASLHPNHISVIERGKRLPTVAALIRIGEALGVPAWELLKEAQQSGEPDITALRELDQERKALRPGKQGA